MIWYILVLSVSMERVEGYQMQRANMYDINIGQRDLIYCLCTNIYIFNVFDHFVNNYSLFSSYKGCMFKWLQPYNRLLISVNEGVKDRFYGNSSG